MELDLFPKLWIFLEDLEGCKRRILEANVLRGVLLSEGAPYSSGGALSVGGVVWSARVVGGLAHGAQRPFHLLLRWCFGGRSEEKRLNISLKNKYPTPATFEIRKWWSRLSFLQTFHRQIIPEWWDLQLIKPINSRSLIHRHFQPGTSSQWFTPAIIHHVALDQVMTPEQLDKSGQWPEGNAASTEKQRFLQRVYISVAPVLRHQIGQKIGTEILQSNISVYINDPIAWLW